MLFLPPDKGVPFDVPSSGWQIECTLPAWQACGFQNASDFIASAPSRFGRYVPVDAICSEEGHIGKGSYSNSVFPTSIWPSLASIPDRYLTFARFLWHDIVAFSNSGSPETEPDNNDLTTIVNLRSGIPRLESLYGGGPLQGELARRFDDLLRYPWDQARFWLPRVGGASGASPRLLTLKELLDDRHPFITQDFLRALPKPLRGIFLDQGSRPRWQIPILADLRIINDPALLDLHLALAREHNARVFRSSEAEDRDLMFREAQNQMRAEYNRFILEGWLPTVCGRATVEDVRRQGAPLFRDFIDRFVEDDGVQIEGYLPLPIEIVPAMLPLWSPVRLSMGVERPPLSRIAGAFDVSLLPSPRACLAAIEDAAGVVLPSVADVDGRPAEYMLREAHEIGQGVLGPLAARLISETLVGLIEAEVRGSDVS